MIPGDLEESVSKTYHCIIALMKNLVYSIAKKILDSLKYMKITKEMFRHTKKSFTVWMKI